MPDLTKPGQFTPSFPKAVIVTAFLIQSEHSLISQQAAKCTHTALPAWDLASHPSDTGTKKVTKPDVFLSKSILLNLSTP